MRTSLLSLSGSAASSTTTVPAESPLMPTKHSRRISWGDASGLDLEKDMRFRKTDEAWKCGENKIQPRGRLASWKKASTSKIASLPELNARLPTTAGALVERLRANPVQLESFSVQEQTITLFVDLNSMVSRSKSAHMVSIARAIRVLSSNKIQKKVVRVRYSFDDGESTQEVSAELTPTNDVLSARFVAQIAAPSTTDFRLRFAIRFTTGGVSFWDTNNEHNYILTLKSPVAPTALLGKAPSKSILQENHGPGVVVV